MITCIVWLVVPEEAIDRLAPGKSPTYCVKELDWERSDMGEVKCLFENFRVTTVNHCMGY